MSAVIGQHVRPSPVVTYSEASPETNKSRAKDADSSTTVLALFLLICGSSALQAFGLEGLTPTISRDEWCRLRVPHSPCLHFGLDFAIQKTHKEEIKKSSKGIRVENSSLVR